MPSGSPLAAVPFDRARAVQAERWRGATRAAGLSLGDRACLALAAALGAAAVPTDRGWAGLPPGMTVETAR